MDIRMESPGFAVEVDSFRATGAEGVSVLGLLDAVGVESAANATVGTARAIDEARAIAERVSALRMGFLLNGPGFVPGTPDMRDILGWLVAALRGAGEGPCRRSRRIKPQAAAVVGIFRLRTLCPDFWDQGPGFPGRAADSVLQGSFRAPSGPVQDGLRADSGGMRTTRSPR
ncbi:hypothetical protein DRB89_19860 [Streptomyces sp. ICC4]|nr:hypothetical protein DRB89_19860 [Streptomyces sp. ICC4]